MGKLRCIRNCLSLQFSHFFFDDLLKHFALLFTFIIKQCLLCRLNFLQILIIEAVEVLCFMQVELYLLQILLVIVTVFRFIVFHQNIFVIDRFFALSLLDSFPILLKVVGKLLFVRAASDFSNLSTLDPIHVDL